MLRLGVRVIKVEIISVSNFGNRAFIPRMPMSPSDKNKIKKNPFKIQRRQFPLTIVFTKYK